MKNAYLIDWLTFSVKCHTVNEILSFLQIDEIIPMLECTKGYWRYEHCISYGKLSILYGGTNNSITVNMSGQGCRTFETYSKLSWHELLYYACYEPGNNITRFDMAFDSFDKKLKLDKVERIATKNINALRNNEKTTNLRTKFEYIDVHNTTKGLTVYFGSNSSDIQIMMYDKARERGYEIEDKLDWKRTEIQLRNENAQLYVQNILKGELSYGEIFSITLNNYLAFINEDDINKSRCTLLSWWEKYLETTKRIKIFERKNIDYNLPKLEKFLNHNCSSSIKTYYEIYGQKGIDDIIKNAKTLSAKQKKIIKDNKKT